MPSGCLIGITQVGLIVNHYAFNLPVMSAKSFPINTSTAEKLELDTHVSFAPANATHIKHPSGASMLSPSTPPLTRSPPADVHSNRQLDILHRLSSQQSEPVSVASAVVKMLEDMGVQYAFGVSGGAIAPLWATLQHSSIQVLHFRMKREQLLPPSSRTLLVAARS